MVTAPSAPAPQFQSTSTVWPLQGTSSGTKTTTDPAPASSKSKSRNRNRKKPAKASGADTAPPPPPSSVPATSKSTSAQTKGAAKDPNRTSFPWRGSGRGRGRGGATTTRGGAVHSSNPPVNGASIGNGRGVRGFSTAINSALKDGGKADEEAGVKVQRTALFQSAQQGAASRRSMQTDAASTEQPIPSTSTPQTSTSSTRHGGGPGRGSGRGRGRGKGLRPAGGDRGNALLEKVKTQAGDDDLEAQIQALYDIQRPSPESIAAREHLISELTDYLNRERFHWGHPHSPSAMPLSIEPFGSIRFGLGTSNSDLDLCLLDPYRPNGFEDKWYSSRKEHMQDLPDIYQMRKIGNSLYRAGLDNIHPIPDAAVPICKFEVEIDGQMIQADLNTNERLGVYNSRLLNSYCNLHPLVRPLSVFIKFWASQRGLNNPSGDRDGIVTFSSYTLILLVISYLQKVKILPNLQDEELIASTQTERSRFFSTPKAYSRRGKLKHLIRSVGWDVTFVEYESEPEGFQADEAVNLVDLARGFFHYWGDEFDSTKNVVSIANGAPFARERLFGDFADPIKPTVTEDDAKEKRNGDSDAERTRQEMADLTLEAFATEDQQEQQQQVQQPEGGGAAQTDDPRAELEAISQAQSELDAEREKATRNRSRANSRSSSPIPYGDFAEPEKWTEHLLVVQDPFILTRNCAGNVRPDWVEELRVQMRRARDLIDKKAPLTEICLHHYSDPDFLPIAFAKHRARVAEEKKRHQEAKEKKLQLQQAQANKEAEERTRLGDDGGDNVDPEKEAEQKEKETSGEMLEPQEEAESAERGGVAESSAETKDVEADEHRVSYDDSLSLVANDSAKLQGDHESAEPETK